MQGVFESLIEANWVFGQFAEHTGEMLAWTVTVFLVGLGVGKGMAPKDHAAANEAVALRIENMSIRSEVERLQSTIDGKDKALKTQKERNAELAAMLDRRKAEEAKRKERERKEETEREEREQKEAREKIRRGSARAWVTDLGASDKRLLRRLTSGSLVTTYLGRSSFDAIVRSLRNGVEYTEVDYNYMNGNSSYRLWLNDFGKLAVEAGADVLDVIEDCDDLDWLEMRE